MARALGFAAAKAKSAALQDRALYATAERGREITTEKHRTAPRGGSYLNRYGQPRSAPGEPAAPEEGILLDLLQTPPAPAPSGGYEIISNYAVLEFGTIHMGARPLGRLSNAELKQEVESGGPIKPQRS